MTGDGPPDAVVEYHANNPGTPDPHLLLHIVMRLKKVDEDEKAIEHLMRMHKLKGCIDDWLPGYKDAIIGQRCR